MGFNIPETLAGEFRMIKKILSFFDLDLRKEDSRLFLFCLFLYCLLFFVPNLKIFFALFFLLGIFIFLDLKKLKLALWFLLIISLPFCQGKAQEYPLVTSFETGGSFSYSFFFSITPLDIIVAILLFIFLRERWFGKGRSCNSGFHKTDLVLLLFLMTGFVSIFHADFPEVSFLSLLMLTRSVSVYFLATLALSSNKTKRVTTLLFLPLIFQEGFWALMQYGLRSPLGRFLELSLSRFPYGVTASESVYLFRSVGTRAHPNHLGPLMVFFLPIIASQIFRPSVLRKPLLALLSFIAALVALVLSFSRGAWLIAGFMVFFVIWLFNRQKIFFLPELVKKLLGLSLLPLFCLGIFLVYPRLLTLEEAFLFRGSGNARVDLAREAINLMQLYPLGVGLDNFVPSMFHNYITEVVEYFPSLVHNTFFIIGSEMGVFGLAFFLFFIFLTGKHFMTRIYQYRGVSWGLNWGIFLSFLSYLLLSLVYPLFSFHFLDYFLLICAMINLI
jgi:O-antigen ligase